MQPIDLNSISLKSPCAVPWETMTGDERTRFCAQCKLNVFNLSGMTRAEAEEVIRNKEGRLCVRYVKRADGTLLTRDCAPIRAARLRRAAALAIAALVVMVINIALVFDRATKKTSLTANLSPYTGQTNSFTHIKQSRFYQSSPPVQAVVDWTEQQLAPTPGPTVIIWGQF